MTINPNETHTLRVALCAAGDAPAFAMTEMAALLGNEKRPAGLAGLSRYRAGDQARRRASRISVSSST